MNSFNYDVKNKRCDLSWVMKWCVKVYKVSFWGSKLVFFFFLEDKTNYSLLKKKTNYSIYKI